MNKKRWFTTWWGVSIIIVLVFILLSSFGGNSDSQSEITNQNTKEENTDQKEALNIESKSYKQVFTFSGNGAKKSEPFNIQGDRFKISYDCKGDPSATLCTAFVFRVGSSLPQGVMNSAQATKDETIIYTNMAGKGEYYIDANVLGSFTMTVYEYK